MAAMQSGTIRFAGTDLGLYGPVRFTINRTPDPSPPARATHYRVEIAVTLELDAAMSATAWARLRAVNTALASTREGLLEILDENRNVVSWNACPGESSLPEAIVRGHGRAELKFTAIEPVSAGATPLDLTIDPLDGSAPIFLNRCTNWAESIRISRPDARNPHRDEIASTVTFAARCFYADPSASLAARAAALQDQVNILRALNGATVQLTSPGFDKLVQVESIAATPSESWDFLTVQAQCRYTAFPDATEAEVRLSIGSSQDPTTGEIRTSLSGEVRAETETIANAKIDAILTAWRTPARRVARFTRTPDLLIGSDSPAGAWLTTRFQIELVEGSGDSRYTLKIDTREDAEGQRMVYSGTAYASDLTTLLATVAEAAAGKHPVELRNSLSVDWATDIDGTLKIGSASFSYEYAAPPGKIRGSFTRTISRPTHAEWTAGISGTLTAPSLGTAKSIALLQIPPGVVMRDHSERQVAHVYQDPDIEFSTLADQDVSFEFTYTWAVSRDLTAIRYRDASTQDYARMVQERTISGTCFASDRTTAAAQVALLLAALSFSNPTKSSFSHENERAGDSGPDAIDRWIQFDFSYSSESAITSSVGFDIIEAEFSVERTGMVDHKPITEVPLSLPVQQSAFGYNTGRLVASGTVKARQQATAVAWGQAKRSKAATAGSVAGAEDPPTERLSVTHLPFSGTTATVYVFSFSYSFRFASGLTGLWNQTL